MKFDKKENDLLRRFIITAPEITMYDEKNICVLQLSNLKNHDLSLTGNKIVAVGIPYTHFEFSFEDYDLSTATIYFFKKDGYVLKVFNVGDGYDIIPELEKFKN